jgi:hypothetical protein
LALVLAASSAVAAFLGGTRTAVSVALGIGLSAANLLSMRFITRSLMRPDGASALWALALPVKLLALVGAAFLLVETLVARAVPLALGFAVLPMSAVFLPRPKATGRAVRSTPVAESPALSAPAPASIPCSLSSPSASPAAPAAREPFEVMPRA